MPGYILFIYVKTKKGGGGGGTCKDIFLDGRSLDSFRYSSGKNVFLHLEGT